MGSRPLLYFLFNAEESFFDECDMLTIFLRLLGKNCEIDIDECSSNPCKNDGVCIDRVNGYFCNCTDDFMGVDCEKDFDACAFNPCKNGGTCGTKPRRREYYCDCPAGNNGQPSQGTVLPNFVSDP